MDRPLYYYEIINNDGKVWIMPSCNMRTGMELYQPSGFKGKLLKYLFPFLHQCTLIRKKIRIEKTEYNLESDIKNIVSKLFNISSFDYATFLGSPGPRQKVTIQIFTKSQIFGYVKTSKSKEIAESFNREAKALDFLKKKGISNIPNAYYCEKINQNWVFIQSTTKTIHSKVINRLTIKHIQFVRNLFERTKQTLPFEQTDLYLKLEYLKSNIENINPNDYAILTRSIDTVEKHYKGIVLFGFMHGDFTPWNLYVEKGEINAFDFEYAEYTCPPYMDIIHFIIQICILVKNKSIDETYDLLREKEHLLPIDDHKQLILAYLLCVFSQYTKLFDGKFSSQDRSYKMWIGLMNKYNKI